MTTVITAPDTEDTHYGIPVCHIGEDGAILALGHPGERRALAAFNRHARVFCRLVNLADDFNARLADWTGLTTEKWVVFRKPEEEKNEDPDWEWVFDASTEGEPNALPVTILDPTKGTIA
jgi:hypothetical protein